MKTATFFLTLTIFGFTKSALKQYLGNNETIFLVKMTTDKFPIGSHCENCPKFSFIRPDWPIFDDFG